MIRKENKNSVVFHLETFSVSFSPLIEILRY